MHRSNEPKLITLKFLIMKCGTISLSSKKMAAISPLAKLSKEELRNVEGGKTYYWKYHDGHWSVWVKP